jgi:peptide/nickel transport system ATP-binding protein/oligopeptide transport system ATP-binding protein
MTRLLDVSDLKVTFGTLYGTVTALDSVSFHVDQGETLGIVGESGCGKSITALSLMGLIPTPPGKITAGSIKFLGNELIGLPPAQLRSLRGSDMAMIFQEPMTSLNPVFTVGDQIAEAITLHQKLDHENAFKQAVELLDRVGIPSPEKRARDFPYQLSGGMRQRVMIAMAVSCRPKILIADEPTTALDVTVQAQIFDLLNEVQQEFGAAIILITHDMGAISEMADRVAVMYAGRIIEEGRADDILDHPQHPYTRGLISCIPSLDQTRDRLREIPGIVPPLHELGAGCAFAKRCDHDFDRCLSARPSLSAAGHHPNACFAVEEQRL